MNLTTNENNITIQIPITTLIEMIKNLDINNENNETQLIVMSKKQVEEYESRTKPQWITMKQLQEEMQRDRSWIMKHIIRDPYFRRKIEKFTQFPINDSGKYLFHRKKILKFIDDYAEEIVERSNYTIRIEHRRKNHHRIGV